MNCYFYFLVAFLSVFSQFSGHCSDKDIFEEKEKTLLRSSKTNNSLTWEELLVYSPVKSSSSIIEKRLPKRIQLRNNDINSGQEIKGYLSVDEPRQNFNHRFTMGNLGDSRQDFYKKYGVHYTFQSDVEVKISDTKTLYQKGDYSSTVSFLLESIWDRYFKGGFAELEEKERDILKELISNGKLVSESFFVQEKAYKERIRLLENTMKEGKETFDCMKIDHDYALEDKDKIISMQQESIQSKKDLEQKALNKTKDILRLMGVGEVEEDMLLNLCLLEKLVRENKNEFNFKQKKLLIVNNIKI